MSRTAMRTLLSLSLAGVLAGCSLAPTYERPGAPVAQHYPDAGDPAASGVAADIGWREFFRDPLLQELLTLALDNNRDLRVAALNVEAARAQYRIQRADLMPSVGAAGNATVQRTPGDMTATGQAQISRQYQVGAAVSAWELDLFGRVRNLSDQALQQYLAQDETRIAAQLTLLAETANAYLTLLADQELLQLTRETLVSQQDSYRLTHQSYEQGVATALDLSQAEISLRIAERNMAQYERQLAQDRNALVLLIGQPLSQDMQARLAQQTRLPDDAVLAELPAGLPSDLLVRRPDIRAAEHVLQGANARIGAARAAFFPSISLTGSAGTMSASLGGLFDAGSGSWSFAPQIYLPIFAGGALSADLDLAHVRKRIEVANYEKAIQSGFREVADGLAGRATLGQQIQAQRLLVQASQRAYDLSDQRFRQGVDSYLSVLDSQRSLYEAQQVLVDTRLARLSNLITLYKSLGGGWTEHTPLAEAS
ncbi:multidrug efflux system outer membrane protein [Bordetella trematum]|uniref:efflux transporter outer membrane subunit n=1 Tax=Bordetella trematum TaxID=123899 RepID=UPI0007994D57|nr:multidrug efflux system outer membrane protein [Bordetella trematum]